jgi:hypothetical protein
MDSTGFHWIPLDSMAYVILFLFSCRGFHWIPQNLQESTSLESYGFHRILMDSMDAMESIESKPQFGIFENPLESTGITLHPPGISYIVL